ncbi:ATP-dependent nuclease [Stenotrophomonas sp. JC08]|uniref:ATP-dependent nuclease n=1 Tax=Stenotrophomonas sp. JC08 TaxID=3445779 RepID=UPI003FA2A286
MDWMPRPGLNAILGSGDFGKSTVLDAIALAMSSTRREVFYDTDFFRLDPAAGFEIFVTLGELPDELKDVDRYGDYLRGWNPLTREVEDEPGELLEDVLTLRLAVGEDLEGYWSLFSDRTAGQEPRDLSLPHRALIAPVVLDQSPVTHLRWARQSILQRLAEPQFSVRSLVARAARGLREQAADEEGVDAEVEAVVTQVNERARELGIRPAQDVQVLLDAFGIPGWNASLALHDNQGVPLRRLGTGSSRLLVAGLFHSRMAPAGIALVDEAEFGLEPHRIARFLRLLGAGDDGGPQVFLTTHSPVVVRELRATELAIAHCDPILGTHEITNVADTQTGMDTQALVRQNAESFLAASIIVAEGPTEIGLVRGLDYYWISQGQDPLALAGIAISNGNGIPQAAPRAAAYAKLGYRTALLMDDDRPLTAEERAPVDQEGVKVISWGAGHATEEALFNGLGWPDVLALVAIAEEIWGEGHLSQGTRNASGGVLNLAGCRVGDNPVARATLAAASKSQGWFKRIDFGERVGQEVVGPGYERATPELRATLEAIYWWTRSGQDA